MDEYLLLTVCSEPGEGPAAFASRLSAFWTRMLRQQPDTYEQVYAEKREFEADGSRLYLIEADAVEVLQRELQAVGLAHLPIDRDDVYSKYEATPSEWMQLAH